MLPNLSRIRLHPHARQMCWRSSRSLAETDRNAFNNRTPEDFKMWLHHTGEELSVFLNYVMTALRHETHDEMFVQVDSQS